MTLDASPDSNSQAQDLCDYQMSDTAICEARRVGLAPGLPYLIGFRNRPQAPDRGRSRDLKDILALGDEAFRRYLQRAARHEQTEIDSLTLQALQAKVLALETVVRVLQSQLSALAAWEPRIGAKHVQGVCGPVRGLDIEPR